MKCGFFGLQNMVFAMPSNFVDVGSLARSAGYTDEMVARLHSGGLKLVPVHDKGSLLDLVKDAIHNLVLDNPKVTEGISAFLLAHSVPLLAPAKFSFLSACLANTVQDEIVSVAVSGQPCSIMHMAVQLAGGWLKDLPSDKGVLLVGADQAYSVKDRIFFGSAMGDVAVAMVVTRDTTRNRVLASVSESDIIATGGEESPQEDIAKFRNLNPLYIRHAIESCLRDGGITLNEVAYIVPHTPYTMIWDTLSDLLRFSRKNIITDYIGRTGHMNSNDSFVHYISAVNDGKIAKGDKVLLVNPGFGGTRGCTLIER